MGLKAVANLGGGGGGTVTGTGTPDTLAKFATASSVGDSVVTESAGAIASITRTAGGAGYTNGTYAQQALTGGAGTGATADFVVAGGIITVVTLRAPGVGYVAANTLSCATIGAGAGLIVTVATVVAAVSTTGNVTANRLGAGTTNPRAGLDVASGGGIITGVTRIAFRATTASAETYLAMFGTVAPSTTNYGLIIAPQFDLVAGTVNNPSIRGIHAAPIALTSAAGTTQIVSIGAGNFEATRSSASDLSTSTSNLVRGVSGIANISATVGAASTQSAQCFNAQYSNSAAAHTVTDAFGYRAICANVGITTTYTAFGLSASLFTNSGTITTLYGLRLEAPTIAGTITNRFPIAQEDTLGTNSFRAKTAFGPATGTAPGDASASVEITTNGTTNGNLRLNTASAVLDVSAASTNGVKFNNPGTPGTITSTTLTNYQEGTYTVLDSSGGGLLFTQNMVAKYTRVGRNVTVIFDITYPASVGIYGALPAQITLPISFTGGGGLGVIYSGSNARYGNCYNGYLQLFVYGSGTQLTNAAMAGAQIICGCTYII